MRECYNCARTKSNTAYSEQATDWKLILQRDNSIIPCNLWEFIDNLGGPSGIGRKMMKDATNMHSAYARQNKRAINILLFSTSYVWQVLQALKCGWSNDITLSLMQKNASYLSDIESVKKSAKKLVLNKLVA